MDFKEKIENFKLSKKFKYIYFSMLLVLFPIVIIVYGIIYFGGLWDPLSKVKNLEIAVVNRDVGCPVESNFLCLVLSSQLPVAQLNLGNNIVENIKTSDTIKDVFDWKFENITEAEATKGVDDYDYWGVMLIPENFTQEILSQLDTTSYQSPEAQTAIITQISEAMKIPAEQIMKMYDMSVLAKKSKPVMKYIYDYARSYTGMTFVTTYLETIDNAMKKSLAMNLHTTVGEKGSFVHDFYKEAYETKYVDIHPLNKFGENFGSFIVLVMIYISSISVCFVYRKFRPFDSFVNDKNSKVTPFIGVLGKIGINISYMIITCFLLCITLVMFGDAQVEHSIVLVFLVMLLWSFLALAFCNLASNVLPLLPFLGISVIFMIIQLATCSGIIAVEFQPGFWSIGKGLPMYYATGLMKYLLFDTGARYNTKNLLLLILWIAIICVLDILTSIFDLNKVRRRTSMTSVNATPMSEKKAIEATQGQVENGNVPSIDITESK